MQRQKSHLRRRSSNMMTTPIEMTRYKSLTFIAALKEKKLLCYEMLFFWGDISSLLWTCKYTINNSLHFCEKVPGYWSTDIPVPRREKFFESNAQGKQRASKNRQCPRTNQYPRIFFLQIFFAACVNFKKLGNITHIVPGHIQSRDAFTPIAC